MSRMRRWFNFIWWWTFLPLLMVAGSDLTVDLYRARFGEAIWEVSLVAVGLYLLVRHVDDARWPRRQP